MSAGTTFCAYASRNRGLNLDSSLPWSIACGADDPSFFLGGRRSDVLLLFPDSTFAIWRPHSYSTESFDFLLNRTRRPSPSVRTPNRFGFCVTGHRYITFETAKGASRSRIPPCLTF